MRDGPRFYIGAAGTVGENKLVSDTAFVGNKGFDIGYALAASLDPKALKIDEWRVFSGEASYPTSGNYLPQLSPSRTRKSWLTPPHTSIPSSRQRLSRRTGKRTI